MFSSNIIYANDKFSEMQEEGIPYDFLSRRTEAQLNELYRMHYTGEYDYESSKVYEQKGAISFETAVFINRTEDEKYIEDIILLMFYTSKDAYFLAKKEENVVVKWDPDKLTYAGDVVINCYSGTEVYYHEERLTEAKQGMLGYTIELEGDALSGIAALKMVPTIYPSEYDKNLIDIFDVEYTEDSNSNVIVLILCVLIAVFTVGKVVKRHGRKYKN